jgi:hypothetical protein
MIQIDPLLESDLASSRARELSAARLSELDSEFTPLFLACLANATRGRRGLFGANHFPAPSAPCEAWPEAIRARDLAYELQWVAADLGQSHEVSAQFLRLCALPGGEAPSEARMSQALLDLARRLSTFSEFS